MRFDTPHQSFSIGSVGKWDSNEEKQYEMKHLGSGFEEFKTTSSQIFWENTDNFPPYKHFITEFQGFYTSCVNLFDKNSQSKCWTFCLHPLMTLISKLSQRPASRSPDLLGPHNSQSQICPEKLTGMFQHSDGSMPRASLFITSRLTAAAAALPPLLSLLQTLTQSGSNPYFTIQDKMECSLFTLFKPLFSWI